MSDFENASQGMSKEIEREKLRLAPGTGMSLDPNTGAARPDMAEVLMRFGQYALVQSAIADVIEEAVGLLVTHLDVEFSKVLELLPDQKFFLLRAGVGWQKGLTGNAIISAQKQILPSYVLQSQTPVTIEDLLLETRFTVPAVLHDHNIRSGAAVAIHRENGPFGVLGVHTVKPRQFSVDDVHFLQMVANILTAAIRRKEAEDERDRLYRETTQQMQRLEILREISAAVTSTLDLDSVLNVLMDKVDELLPYSAMLIWLVDPDNGELTRAVCRNVDETEWRQRAMPALPPILKAVLRDNAPVYVRNIRADARTWDRSFYQLNGLVSYLALPLSAKGEVLGTLSFCTREEYLFTPEEMSFLTMLGSQAAIAIKNSRLYAQAEKYSQELSALNAVTVAANQSLELGDLLDEVIKTVTEVFSFDVSRVYLLDPETNQLQPRASYETEPELLMRMPEVRLGQGNVGHVAATGEPLIYEDVSQDPHYSERSPDGRTRKAGLRFFASFPIKSKSRTVGTIVCSGRKARRLSTTEIHLITTMASQIGVAVENAKLFAETRERSAELEALVNTNREIAAMLERETLLPRIAEEAVRLLGADGGNFRVVEGDQLVEYNPLHMGGSAFRRSFGVSEGVTGRVVREGRPIGIPDLHKSEEVSQEHRAVALQYGYRAFLGVPLQVGGRVLGSINLYSRNERVFSVQEIALVSAFASQAAVAMENANLFAEIQNQTSRLRELNSELHEANETKSTFLSAMSHELRTPLQVILGYSALLADGFGGRLSTVQEDALKTIHHNAEVYLQLIENVLTLTKLEASRMALNVASQPLPETLKHVEAFIANLNRSNRLAVIWDVEPNLPVMHTDHLKVEEILQNLIGNAYKFTQQGQISIRVRHQPEDDLVELIVADTGMGIAAAKLESIFDEFHQLEGAHTGELRGVGLGLSIVKQYLQMLGGDIRVDSEPGVGTRFTVHIPCSQPL